MDLQKLVQGEAYSSEKFNHNVDAIVNNFYAKEPTTIHTSSDFSSIYELPLGIFRITGSWSDGPITTNLEALVEHFESNGIRVMRITNSQSICWYSVKASSTWGNWVRIMNHSEIDERGYLNSIMETVDANNLVSNGKYRGSSTVLNTPKLNHPWIMDVSAYNNDFIIQRLYSHVSTTCYVRFKQSAVWTEWEVVHTSKKHNFPITPAVGYTLIENHSYYRDDTLYINAYFKKTDNSNFAASSFVTVGTIQFNIIGNMLSFGGRTGSFFKTSGVGIVYDNVIAVAPSAECDQVRVSGTIIIKQN